ncbi:MAG TPA: vitamin K epoxide reductase family protein [Streptosporangiaceae bacterium]|nr:vitamin K epoxide reductase family protein [Streptosporangiaceae bacterium]
MAASKSSRTRKPAGRGPVHASPTAMARTPVTRTSAVRPSARTAADEPEYEAPRTAQIAPTWLQWTTFVLAVGGLGVSIYLTIEHFTGNSTLACSDNGLINCAKVTTSAQSWVWVIPHHWAIPVSVLGLAFYALATVPLMSPWAWRITDHVGPVRVPPTLIPWIRLVSLVLGMAFVLYLLYAELVWIRNICLYCTSVHAITFLLFTLTVGAAAMWGLNPARRED